MILMVVGLGAFQLRQPTANLQLGDAPVEFAYAQPNLHQMASSFFHLLY